MSNRQALLLFLGMTLVTYFSRGLPVLLLGRLKPGPRLEKFLRLIPYTAMSALVFPGALTMDAGRPWIGLAGVGVSALLALKKCPAVLCVLAGIAAVFLLYLAV